MALHRSRGIRPDRAIAVELGIVASLLVVVSLWQRLVRVLVEPLGAWLGSGPTYGALPIVGLAGGGLFVAGLATLAGTYASSRGIDVGLERPSGTDLSSVGLAAFVPPLLVGLTKLVGSLTGVSYSSLATTYYGTDVPIRPVLAIVGLGLLVGVPSLVLTCQVIVQGSVERVLDDDGAVVLTTLATGFVMTSNTGGLATAPEPGKLVGAVLFVLVLGAGLYVTEHVEGVTRSLAHLPALLFVALVVASGVAGIQSVADGLFALTHLGVLGIAAYTYDRSGSLLVPALAYLSLSLASATVLVAVEAGLHPW